ncbi:NUDIX hydrolase [Nitrospirillum sp. BR 11828]|uniref:NUDIX hydrolase n=1 Tax=Nitrospirillum sp. BR 11828 TaxID=3104325 RepID=UPI002ACA3571|nr:NUDIX hydrolase [Nitrospirillum sp. BR 11828]MDZ5647150.1 NUDIX hydrolase [Nitrospirillum sp. BR 11828]
MSDQPSTQPPASPHLYPDQPRVGVGVLVWKGDQLLLIRRAKAPLAGEWCLPGGSQELGETLFQTAAREVREETAVTCRPYTVLTAVDGITRDPRPVGAGPAVPPRVRFHFTIVEIMAEYGEGEPVAGDDAAAVLWADRETCDRLVTWPSIKAVVDLGWAARAAGG